MRRITTLFAIMAFWSCTSLVSPALALDPETLRQDLKAVLDSGKSSFGPDTVEYKGLKTAARGEAVRVDITGLRLRLPDIEGRLDLGDLAFTVAEAGDRLYQVSDMQTASQATLIDKEGQEAGFINYELARLSGIWSSALLTFLDIDFAVKRMEIVVPEDGFALALAEAALQTKTTARADGLTDITSDMQAYDLRVIMPKLGTVEIREMLGTGTFEGQDMATYQVFAEDFQALVGSANQPLDKKRVDEIVERLSDVRFFPQSFLESVRVLGITVSGPESEPVFSLAEAEFDMVGNDLNQALARGSFGLRYAGMQATKPAGQAADPMQALVPGDAGLVLSVERLPTEPLWRGAVEAMALAAMQANQTPDQQTMMSQALGLAMLNAINQARSLIRLDRLELQSPAGRISATGSFEADPTTAIGAKGRFDMTVAGLDRMLAIAADAAQSQGGAPHAPGGELSILMLLKSMAKRETAADGSPIDRFEIVLTPAGDVLVNGKPFQMAPPQ